MTKTFKTILIVIAAALIFVIVGGLIIHFARPDNGGSNVNKPSIDIEKPNEDLVVIDKGNMVVDGNGNELKEGKVYAMPRNIMFYSATNSPTSVIVKATIKPSNADDKRVIWESSDDSIVSVEQSATDPLTATITRKGTLTFGRETITCRSVGRMSAFMVEAVPLKHLITLLN